MTETLPDPAASAFCYVLGPVTGALFLLMPPYNTNRAVRFHAWQSIYLFVAAMLLYGFYFGAVFLLPWALVGVLWFLMFFSTLGLVGLWFYLVFQTYSERKLVLPVVGRLAERRE